MNSELQIEGSSTSVNVRDLYAEIERLRDQLVRERNTESVIHETAREVLEKLRAELRGERDRLDLACDLLEDYVLTFQHEGRGPDWNTAWDAVEEIKKSQAERSTHLR